MKVQLKAKHTHNGVECQPDDIIDVNEVEADWLISHNICDIVEKNNKKQNNNKEE